jgi:hypothetical protein
MSARTGLFDDVEILLKQTTAPAPLPATRLHLEKVGIIAQANRYRSLVTIESSPGAPEHTVALGRQR